jgi:hypothetical protein
MDAPTKAYACNCSICSRSGWLLAFVDASVVKLLSGADDLKDYQFGKKSLHHEFCKVCGVRAFSRGSSPDGKATFAINLRCIQDVDASLLPVETFDGKSI